MPNILIPVGVGIIMLIVGWVLHSVIRNKQEEKDLNSARHQAQKILEDARSDAELKHKEAMIAAKDEIYQLRQTQEKANQKRVDELQEMEKRILKREESLERKGDQLDRKNEQLSQQLDRLQKKEARVDALVETQHQELERIAQLNQEQAQQIILEEAKQQTEHEQAKLIRESEQRVKEQSQNIAREIITRTIQRYSADYVAESTVYVVSLPNDEMKGRIIGREGRNIRAFETLTGVDLIIDDTPQAVILSCFDPVRREKARIALEKLIADGRIHPTRIEELYAKAEQEVEVAVREAGELALEKVGIRNMHPEIVKTIGKMRYRTSYGQNALAHSIEVAKIAAMLAQEVGANVKVAKRGALLHDLGKAIDHEIEAPHVELGVKMAKKYKESREVIHCIESHHNDVEPQTVEAFIVQAADAISAARPGARRESMEHYIKRLQDLENIANSFDGIEQSYAIQAGREIRVLVKPEKISEDRMTLLAQEIAHKVEEELEYPGQIRINLIRETRAEGIAR